MGKRGPGGLRYSWPGDRLYIHLITNSYGHGTGMDVSAPEHYQGYGKPS
jgi:hypothetical protein